MHFYEHEKLLRKKQYNLLKRVSYVIQAVSTTDVCQ